jgi:hypothetical protein
MTEDLQKRIQAALANPQNMGEMAGVDSIGTVGNAVASRAAELIPRCGGVRVSP